MAINKIQDDSWNRDYRNREIFAQQQREPLVSRPVAGSDALMTAGTPGIAPNAQPFIDFEPLQFDWSDEFDSKMEACSAGDQQACVAVFGNAPFSQTQMPVSSIQPVGFSGSPLVSSENGVTAGSYKSFADSDQFKQPIQIRKKPVV